MGADSQVLLNDELGMGNKNRTLDHVVVLGESGVWTAAEGLSP